jgi:hypothetical protein
LISTVLLTAKQQVFFAEHLPSLTNIKKNENPQIELERFLNNLLFNSITSNHSHHA